MFSRGVLVNSGKLLFLAGWGLALGACMNDANAHLIRAKPKPNKAVYLNSILSLV